MVDSIFFPPHSLSLFQYLTLNTTEHQLLTIGLLARKQYRYSKKQDTNLNAITLTNTDRYLSLAHSSKFTNQTDNDGVAHSKNQKSARIT